MLLLDVPMPKYCYECPCRNEKTGKCNITFRHIDFKKPSDCPLKEVKDGAWLYFSEDNWYECSECGHRSKLFDMKDLTLYSHCSQCGTRMTSIRDDENNYKPIGK